MTLAAAAMAIVMAALLGDAAFGSQPVFAVLGWLVVAAFAVVLVKLEPLVFVLSFLYFLGQFGAMTGGVLIEGGAYVSEQARQGFATGSTLRLALYWLFFIAVATLLFRRLGDRWGLRTGARAPHLSGAWRWAIYALALAVLGVVVAGLVINGAPLIERTDRFSYWRGNAVPFLQPVHNQLSTVVFLLGIAFAFTRRRQERLFVLALVASSLVYFVLQGEKFTALVHVGFGFVLPVAALALARPGAGISLVRLAMAGIAAMAVLTSLILFQYVTVFDADAPVDRLVQRIALQGHVWWGVDERVAAGMLPVPPSTQRLREAVALIDPRPAEHDVGMTLLMRTVAPEDLVQRYRRQGIRFTMGYPAIGLYLLGPAGVLALQVVAALLFVAVALYLVRSVTRARIVHAVVAYKLSYEVYAPFATGDLHELINPKLIVYAALLLFAVAIDHIRRRRRVESHAETRGVPSDTSG